MVDLEKLKRWLIQVPLLWLIKLIASILYSNSILPGVPTELIEGRWFPTHPASYRNAFSVFHYTHVKERVCNSIVFR